MMEHCLLPEPSPPCLTYIYFVMNCQRHQPIMQVVNSYILLQFQLVSSEITLGIVCNHSIFVCKSEVRTVVAMCDGCYYSITRLFRKKAKNTSTCCLLFLQLCLYLLIAYYFLHYIEHMGETRVNTSILHVRRN
jgi:hypothetical protein